MNFCNCEPDCLFTFEFIYILLTSNIQNEHKKKLNNIFNIFPSLVIINCDCVDTKNIYITEQLLLSSYYYGSHGGTFDLFVNTYFLFVNICYFFVNTYYLFVIC